MNLKIFAKIQIFFNIVALCINFFIIFALSNFNNESLCLPRNLSVAIIPI